MSKQNRIYSGAVIKSDAGVSRQFTATITAETIDRDREVLLPQGMIATEFNKSPTVFWNHDYNRPVGTCDKLTKLDTSWSAKARIASRPAEMQGEFFPDTVWALIDQGIVKGVSVGFEPIEYRNPTAKDRAKWGESVTRIISKWMLLEWSIAPLQANTDAVITAVGKGLLTRDVAVKAYPGIEFPSAKKRTVIVVVPAGVPSAHESITNEIKRRMGALY
jgi:hypothetical protein